MKFKNPLRLNEQRSDQPSSRGRSAVVAAGLVLVVGTVPLIGQSVSATTQDGVFQVQAIDTDSEFTGLAGMVAKNESTNPGPTTPPAENPGDTGGYTQKILYRTDIFVDAAGRTGDYSLYAVDNRSGKKTLLKSRTGREDDADLSMAFAEDQSELKTADFLANYSLRVEISFSNGKNIAKDFKLSEISQSGLDDPKVVKTITFRAELMVTAAVDPAINADILFINGDRFDQTPGVTLIDINWS